MEHEFRYGLPEPYRDALHTTVDIHFGLWDRIKVLFGGIPTVRVTTMVENAPGRLETEARVYVLGPAIRRSKMLGVVDVAPNQPESEKLQHTDSTKESE